MQAVLWEIPRTQQAWDFWSFHHKLSHEAIHQAIAQKHGLNLPVYPLYPINTNRITDFLQANQQTHLDMDAVLQLQGTDLLEVDVRNESQLSAWIYLHVREHIAAEKALGL
jgi:hypothetical protein